MLTVDSFPGDIEVPGDHSDCNVLIIGRDLGPVLGKELQEVIVEDNVIPANHNIAPFSQLKPHKIPVKTI